MIGRPFSPALLGSAGKVSFFVTLLLSQLMVLVKPEIVDLGVNMLLDASSDEVHFVKGYLKAPASIDLSNVRWITSEDIMFELEDEDVDLEFALDDTFDEDDEYDEYEDFGTGTTGPTGSPETLEPTEKETSNNDEDNVSGEEIQESVGNDTPAEGEVEPTEDAEASEPAGEGDDEEESTVTVEENTEAPAEDEKEDESPGETVSESGNDNNEDGEVAAEKVTANVDEEREPEPETGETEVEDEVEEEPAVEPTSAPTDEEDRTSTSAPTDEEDSTSTSAPTDEEDSTSTSAATDAPTAEDNGGRRSLQVSNQIMEIIVFLAPPDCKKDRDGNCDWVPLGVGAYDDEMVGEMSYCCSQDAVDRNICSSDDIGTMMIDHTIFEGDHRKIPVPSESFQDFEMGNPVFQIEKSGDYVMVIANCNDDGLGIITLGTMEWMSRGGYLPGDQYDFMLFLMACSSIYLVLAIWYFCGMRSYQDAAIPIQKFILGTIVLGLLMHVLKSTDFIYWNQKGTRSEILMYVAIAFGILFQGSLRCLGVMVAMGWGVVRDSLGMAYCKIVFMGLLYSGVALLHESFDAISMSSSGLVSSNTSDELLDLALVLVPVISVINVIFYIWIIRSLKITTEYLKNMNQTSKLRRHLRLRCLIITSLIIIAALTMVNLAERIAILNVIFYPENVLIKPFLTADLIWILRAVGLGNYLFILVGVTFLWRPTADAKDYAMQMQIPTNADDENDLELSCVVPSADDIDDGEGYKIEHAIST